MPEYNITINKRKYRVKLVKGEDEGEFGVEVNGKPIDVKIKSPKAGSISISSIQVTKETFNLEFEKIDRNKSFTIKVNKIPYEAQFEEPLRKAFTQPTSAELAARSERTRAAIPGTLTAPMAGRILSVKAKKGDFVKAGDVVCILEAMKMENEIQANQSGKIKEVNIAEGSPVREREILFVIEPAE